jgi:peptidyl-prolyl cis-trans isomerase D
VGSDITPTAVEIQGLGASRSLVRNVYLAKKGDVLKPEQIENTYVVAVVTDIYKEGTKDVSKARLEVEPLLRNKKKAEMLKQKVGKVTTLEAAAAALGGKKIEIVDSVRLTTRSQSSTIGYEPKVSGAAFNPANKGKVVPEVLEGVSGVYVIRVDSVSTTAISTGDIAEQRKTLYQQTKQYISNPQSPNYPVIPLRNAATIKDKRAEKY